jgi:uncharacterized membrane protein
MDLAQTRDATRVRGSGSQGPLIRASIVLGVGIGGFFDGIVFHQLLQWHHLVSSPYPPTTVSNLQLNTFFDGVFHATTWVVTLLGVWLLLRARRIPESDRLAGAGARRAGAGEGESRILGGGLLAGWGAFNLVEGVVDHYLLGIHHVRPGPDEAAWDLAFLAWGAIFVVAGWWVMRDRVAASERASLSSREAASSTR